MGTSGHGRWSANAGQSPYPVPAQGAGAWATAYGFQDALAEGPFDRASQMSFGAGQFHQNSTAAWDHAASNVQGQNYMSASRFDADSEGPYSFGLRPAESQAYATGYPSQMKDMAAHASSRAQAAWGGTGASSAQGAGAYADWPPGTFEPSYYYGAKSAERSQVSGTVQGEHQEADQLSGAFPSPQALLDQLLHMQDDGSLPASRQPPPLRDSSYYGTSGAAAAADEEGEGSDEDATVRKGIASAVEAFLAGGGDEEESSDGGSSSGAELPEENEHENDCESEPEAEEDIPPEGSEVALRQGSLESSNNASGYAPAARLIGLADCLPPEQEVAHPSMMRGDRLSQSLLGLTCPSFQYLDAQRLKQDVANFARGWLLHDKRPTVKLIELSLRDVASRAEKGEVDIYSPGAIEELKVITSDTLLLFCARHAESFFLWCDCDAEVSILLPGPTFTAQRAAMEKILANPRELFQPPLHRVFVDAIVDKVNSKIRANHGMQDAAGGSPPPAPGLAPAPGLSMTRGAPAAAQRQTNPGAPKATANEEGTASSETNEKKEGKEPKESTLKTAAQLVEQGVTTVMIRNLPSNLTQKRLLDELAASGFNGQFDFCYMPSTFGTGVGKGYAFLNLINSQAMGNFVIAWHGSRRFGMGVSEAVLNITAADLQGREQNVRKWDGARMRRVRNPALRPLVIDVEKGTPMEHKPLEKDEPQESRPAEAVDVAFGGEQADDLP
eukprot:TRINITY_DN55393_c0_g1_i1.p1 TRINITY_DN55393_c0_g1~~TRINITY_DN55393_c0_g1_i1.p1  ORF type:complete len:761 (-),score=143.78 TRINITY_DN55393_c0_g1_i1:91-2274(-)